MKRREEMKKLMKSVLAAASVTALTAGIASAQHETDRAQIEGVLGVYEKALNASDTAAAISVYEADGVFMPQNSPSQVGTDALRGAYDRVFKAITLNVDFEIVEIVQMAPTWAFVRTNSAGTVTVNATGDKGPEANQELFIFHKGDDDVWKIARYAFSTTNPPRQ